MGSDNPLAAAPAFQYETMPSIFLGRSGSGPLVIAWDTNVLIDYFSHGLAMLNGLALPESIEQQQAEELEGLNILVQQSVYQDIRFIVLPETLYDSKRHQISEERFLRRLRAWRDFTKAAYLEDGFPIVDSVNSKMDNFDHEEELLSVPVGNDRDLIRSALEYNVHIFLTRDQGILQASESLKPCGLLICSPLDLVVDLAAEGRLISADAPEMAAWVVPDLQRVSHLIQALDEDAD